MVHHVIFKNNKSVVYGLFDALALRQGSREKGECTHSDGSLKEVLRVLGLDRTVYDTLESRQDTGIRQLDLGPMRLSIVIDKILGGRTSALGAFTDEGRVRKTRTV
jgi:hypothetical protein